MRHASHHHTAMQLDTSCTCKLARDDVCVYSESAIQWVISKHACLAKRCTAAVLTMVMCRFLRGTERSGSQG